MHSACTLVLESHVTAAGTRWRAGCSVGAWHVVCLQAAGLPCDEHSILEMIQLMDVDRDGTIR